MRIVSPKHCTKIVRHASHKTNRCIDRATQIIQGYSITLTTTQVQEAIKQSKHNSSQDPDKLNIRHQKDIGSLGLAFLTSMLKTTPNTNIIPHIWKLANIVPILKLNKDIDKGTSYRLISLLSLIAMEKSILPYLTANKPNTPTLHGYKTQHYTVTALHTLNNTVAKGFNQMALPARTITVALNMSKAFNTINIHTLFRNLLQAKITYTIIKIITNYIKGRKVIFKSHILAASIQNWRSTRRRPFTNTIQHLNYRHTTTQSMDYADYVTITSTHTSTSTANKCIQPYLHKVFAWTNKTISH